MRYFNDLVEKVVFLIDFGRIDELNRVVYVITSYFDEENLRKKLNEVVPEIFNGESLVDSISRYLIYLSVNLNKGSFKLQVQRILEIFTGFNDNSIIEDIINLVSNI